MTEPESLAGTAGLAGVGIYAVKKAVDGLDRLFGPMTDELAEALRRWTEFRLRNVGRVVENANSKTSPEMLKAGQIPFRAASKILDESATADEQIVVEYVGGVLASSRAPGGRDDRGVAFAATIARLSSYDLRAHYVYYSSFARLFLDTNLQVYSREDLTRRGRIFVPWQEFVDAMELSETEGENAIFSSSIYTLVSENLIVFSRAGDAENLRTEFETTERGIIVAPTVSGIQLFLWALGQGQLEADCIVRPDCNLPLLDGIPVPPNARLVPSEAPLGNIVIGI